MNLISKAVSTALLKVAQMVSGQSYSLMDAQLGKFFSTSSKAGVHVNEDAAMKVSVAWACRRVLAETFGCIPRGIYVKDGSGQISNATPADDHPLNEILSHSPNALQTDVEYAETKVHNLTGHGNAYSFVERRGNGQVSSLIPLESQNVQPKVDGKNGLPFYKILDRGKWEDYPREKIWHVKGFGGNGFVGLSPLGAARESLGTAIATEEFGARFFSQGGMPSGIVTVEKFLNPPQREIARENLQQLMGGLGNVHKFALFEGGMKPEPWASMPLEDMQFLLLRQFSILEICRFYRVSPHLVMDLSRATFSNIEQLSQEFITYTMMPYFTRFESSVRRWLLPPKDRSKFFLRFNYEGFLRADAAARGDYLSKLRAGGFITGNQGRAMENLPRSDSVGMDDYHIQGAMVPVDKVGALADSTIKKNSQPARPAF